MTIDAVKQWVLCENLTYLGDAALSDLCRTVQALESESVEGVLIEAGCAAGGSALVIAASKSPSRPFYVYDVFGMIPPPSQEDGPDVQERYQIISSGQSKGMGGRRYYGYEENLYEQVKARFHDCGLDMDANKVHLIPGLYQETLSLTEPVAFAHVDCDWYASVMTCLERIEPHLVTHGVLIIDDYKDWSGCRRAVDEYFADKRGQYEFATKSRLHIIRQDGPVPVAGRTEQCSSANSPTRHDGMRSRHHTRAR
jgi:asparagine synthase (glutamine-hydrolysing)